MQKRIYIFCTIMIGVFLLNSYIYSSTDPQITLSANINQVLSILQSPDLKNIAEKKEKIWSIIYKAFDFSIIAKRALGRNRRKFSKTELHEFTDVFANLLGNTYINKIGEDKKQDYKNIKIDYSHSEMLTKAKAIVRTKVFANNLEVPIDYSMILRKGIWKIYDVKIEGVSLVQNYRSQFNKILFKKSPKHLIERLRKKAEISETNTIIK